MSWRSGLRARLLAGEAVLGTFVKSSDPTISELLAGAGYDFLIADLEHSSLALDDVEAIARAADLHRVPVLARIPAHEILSAGRLLDAGVVGIQVTDVSSSDTLAAIREATAFAPDGRRSVALSHRAGRFGQMPLAQYLHDAAEQLVTIVQIESRAGIAALDQMLDAPHAPDAWFLGPFDLSNDLGHPGDESHPDVQGAFDDVLTAVQARGARIGVFARDVAAAQQWLARGASLIALGSDVTMLAGAARGVLDEWRAGIPAPTV